MNKKSISEKEIEKARVERQWKTVITLIQSFNVKSTAGVLTKGMCLKVSLRKISL